METPFAQCRSPYLWQLVESAIGQPCRIAYRNAQRQLNAVNVTVIEIREQQVIVENRTGERFRLPIDSIDQITGEV